MFSSLARRISRNLSTRRNNTAQLKDINTNSALLRSPQLPAEVVHRVFRHLDIWDSSDSHETRCLRMRDLLACSLVSQSWHREARAFFRDDMFTEIHLSCAARQGDHLHFVELLAESDRLGHGHCMLIERVTIELTDHLTRPLYDRLQEDALVTLLALTGPRFRVLNIRFMLRASEHKAEFRRFFARIKPLCASVREVDLRFMFGDVGDGYAGLPGFLESVAGHLDALNYHPDVKMTWQLKKAIGKCKRKGADVYTPFMNYYSMARGLQDATF